MEETTTQAIVMPEVETIVAYHDHSGTDYYAIVTQIVDDANLNLVIYSDGAKLQLKKGVSHGTSMGQFELLSEVEADNETNDANIDTTAENNESVADTSNEANSEANS
mgnify:CR=1 FL=1